MYHLVWVCSRLVNARQTWSSKTGRLFGRFLGESLIINGQFLHPPGCFVRKCPVFKIKPRMNTDPTEMNMPKSTADAVAPLRPDWMANRRKKHIPFTIPVSRVNESLCGSFAVRAVPEISAQTAHLFSLRNSQKSPARAGEKRHTERTASSYIVARLAKPRCEKWSLLL